MLNIIRHHKMSSRKDLRLRLRGNGEVFAKFCLSTIQYSTPVPYVTFFCSMASSLLFFSVFFSILISRVFISSTALSMKTEIWRQQGKFGEKISVSVSMELGYISWRRCQRLFFQRCLSFNGYSQAFINYTWKVPFCSTKQRLRACGHPRDRGRLRKNARVKSEV
jgi:hypothetical protein